MSHIEKEDIVHDPRLLPDLDHIVRSPERSRCGHTMRLTIILV